jgi:hypothetical protein
MATTTSRLGLRKPGTGDQPSRLNDINAEKDAVDAAVHAQVVTSTTRPTSTAAFQGKRICESDTKNHLIQGTAGSSTGWVHPSVPGFSSGAPASGADDLIDWGEGLVWRHRSVAEGSGYQPLFPYNLSTDLREAKYRATATQSFANNTTTSVVYETAVYTSVDVTANGTNDAWTINRAGLWRICAGTRWASGAATGTPSNVRVLTMQLNGTTIVSTRDVILSAFCSQNVRTAIRLAANDVITVVAVQDSGASRNADPATRNSFISLTWMRG